MFQATSARRLHGSSELFPSRSAAVPLGTPLLSCHQALQNEPDKPATFAGHRAMHSASQTHGIRHTAGGPGSRALLRPGVRHSRRRVNVTWSRCSLDLFPLRGIPTRPLGLTPPLVHLRARHLRRGARGRCYRVSIRSNLGAAPEGAASASMRFITSYIPGRSRLRKATPGRLRIRRMCKPCKQGHTSSRSTVSVCFRC